MNTKVESAFNSYPNEYRVPLLHIRELIYSAANSIPEVGELNESLKWGQPTYSTVKTKTGSPIRLDRFGTDRIAVLFHCQTSLIENFGLLFYDVLEFSGNRAIVMNPNGELPINELTMCIELALTYHLRAKR